MGWRNSSADGSLEMTFEFDEVRNFSEVIIHTNNNKREEIEVSELHPHCFSFIYYTH